jgi:hypothetical protein
MVRVRLHTARCVSKPTCGSSPWQTPAAGKATVPDAQGLPEPPGREPATNDLQHQKMTLVEIKPWSMPARPE